MVIGITNLKSKQIINNLTSNKIQFVNEKLHFTWLNRLMK